MCNVFHQISLKQLVHLLQLVQDLISVWVAKTVLPSGCKAEVSTSILEVFLSFVTVLVTSTFISSFKSLFVITNFPFFRQHLSSNTRF
mmetsp:Transcript_38721/g.51026  ORF Transcript_38721/g.51026 Transcript_38721/m.51026 type:complete len:88 (-) Transcript_38721:558-821(-)